MRLSFTSSFITAAFLLTLSSCKRELTEVSYNGGAAPVLTASATDTISLVPADSSNTAVTFNWTNPNYKFSNGINTFNVSYNLELDSLGANFSSPNKQTVSIVSDLSTSFTVTAFNALVANGLLLSYGSPHNIQTRIKSFIGNGDTGAIAIYSNVLNFTVTPYAPPPKIAPPPTGALFITGSATPQGWLPSPGTTTQQFTLVPGTNGTQFTITIPLTGGNEYKFIGNNGNYNFQYSVATQDTEPDGGPFVPNGGNCIAPSTSGTYVILVNFQTGTFSVTLQ
jgi:starch-binding outer membrane protein SusE/F